MLPTGRKQPLDGGGWLGGLKLDGTRCLAYLDAGTSGLRTNATCRCCQRSRS